MVNLFAQKMDLNNQMISNDKLNLLTFLQLYESFWLYSSYLEKAFEATNNPIIWRNGTYMRSLLYNKIIEGI